MEVDRNLTKIPRVMLDPSRIEGLLSRKRVARAGRGLLPAPSSRPDMLPVAWQLSRDHLAALNEEISAAEPVLHNVYQDRDIFEIRNRSLQQITDLLARMRRAVDRYPFSDPEKDAIRQEIDMLSRNIEVVVAQSRFYNMPLLAPARKVAPLTPETARSAGNVTDIVFVLSRSTSLRRDVRLLAQHASDFASDLVNMGLDVRFGLQTYGRTSQPAGPFRRTVDEFIQDLLSVPLGKEPQNTLEALRNASDDFSFRVPSNRFFVLLTDKEASDDFGDARDLTVETLKASGITLHVLSVNDSFSGVPFSAYEDITRATNGQYINIGVTDYRSTIASLARAVGDRIESSGAPMIFSENRTLPLGPESSETMTVRFPDFRPETLGIEDLKLETKDDFIQACSLIDDAIRNVSEDVGEKRLLHDYLDRILSHFDTLRLYRLDFKI